MRLFIIGLPGVGKSKFAESLSSTFQMPYIDLDHYIEEIVQMSIADYFNKHGEQGFRKIEAEALDDVIKKHPAVILSTGGGTPCFGNNMEQMKANGVCILLKSSFDIIANQIIKDGDSRPLFLGLDRVGIAKKLALLWEERRSHYEQTHIITGVEAVQKSQLLTNRVELFTKKGKSLIGIIEIN
ncbi:MAG: shikimate kinase [Bacteroidia bacterium]|jgi:shikimate kinase